MPGARPTNRCLIEDLSKDDLASGWSEHRTVAKHGLRTVPRNLSVAELDHLAVTAAQKAVEGDFVDSRTVTYKHKPIPGLRRIQVGQQRVLLWSESKGSQQWIVHVGLRKGSDNDEAYGLINRSGGDIQAILPQQIDHDRLSLEKACRAITTGRGKLREPPRMR